MAKIKRILKTLGRDSTGRTNGNHNGSAEVPWYAAQTARPGVAYALTPTGYVILTHRN